MTREIKYRAWDLDFKKILPVQEAKFVDGNLIGVKGVNWDSKVVVMQYTGLKDKNGTEIYENDIIQTPDWHKNADGSTTLSEKNKYMKIEIIEYITKTPFVGFRIPSDCEVIGNIYSNPELLGDNK